MGKKFYKTEKFQKIFYPILYLISAAVIVVSACFIFDSLYYKGVYVDGSSMNPTLIGEGERVHYGIADTHQKALRNLERFDVVTTLYPDSWSTGETTKIKRVWGFPGETLKMTFDDTEKFYTFTVSIGEYAKYTVASSIRDEANLLSFVTPRRTFRVHSSDSYKRNFEVTLGANEYWLMGDNWCGSSDSYSNMSKQRLTFNYLQGKVVRILGTGVIVNNKVTQKQRIYNMYYF